MSIPENVDQVLPGTGKPGGLVVVLDYGSPLSARKKQHLWGMEKSVLTESLSQIGMDTSKIYYTFAVPIAFPKASKPSVSDVIRWHDHLLEEIESVQPTKILALGHIAHACLHGLSKLSSIYDVRGRGQMVRLPSGREVFSVSSIAPYFMTGDNPILYRDFAKDLEKLVHQDRPLPEPRVDRYLCETPQDVREGLEMLSRASAVSCDTETTGLDPYTSRVEAIGFGALYQSDRILDGLTVVIPKELCYHVEVRALLIPFLNGESYSGKIVFHNSKFDLKMLQVMLKQKMTVPNLEDTILMNYVLDERPYFHWSKPHGLKGISRTRYDAEDFKFQFDEFYKQTEDERDYGALYFYLTLDLIYTAQLYQDLSKEIEEEDPNLRSVLDRFLYPGTRAFTDIELHGILVDKEYFEDLKSSIETLLESMMTQLMETMQAAGVPEDLLSNFNPNSWRDIQHILYDILKVKTHHGKKTDKETLLTHIAENPGTVLAEILTMLLDYRSESKALSTYVNGLLARVDSLNRAHGEFNVNGTGTGRLSSSNPNLQNIPTLMGPKIRRGFIAPKGFKFCETDFSQLELRISAHLAQDETMMQAYRDDRDIHTEVAAAAFNVPYDEVTYDQRYAAKYIDFGVIYGRSAAGLAGGRELVDYEWSLDQAQTFIDQFLGQFEGLKTWIEDRHREVEERQYVESLTHRRRRWDLILPNGLGSAQRQAVNTPIQGLASDFTLYALIKIHQILERSQTLARIVSTVHDSLLLEIPDHDVDAVTEIVVGVMTKMSPIPMSVPLKVDCEVGDNWGDLEDYTPKPQYYYRNLKTGIWEWEPIEQDEDEVPWGPINRSDFYEGPFTIDQRIEWEIQNG